PSTGVVPGAQNNLGVLVLMEGKPAEAVPYFERALRFDAFLSPTSIWRKHSDKSQERSRGSPSSHTVPGNSKWVEGRIPTIPFGDGIAKRRMSMGFRRTCG